MLKVKDFLKIKSCYQTQFIQKNFKYFHFSKFIAKLTRFRGSDYYELGRCLAGKEACGEGNPH